MQYNQCWAECNIALVDGGWGGEAGQAVHYKIITAGEDGLVSISSDNGPAPA